MTIEQPKPAKRPYRKPQVMRVRLNAEEAVLTACKAQDGWLPVWGNSTCNWWGDCRDQGS